MPFCRALRPSEIPLYAQQSGCLPEEEGKGEALIHVSDSEIEVRTFRSSAMDWKTQFLLKHSEGTSCLLDLYDEVFACRLPGDCSNILTDLPKDLWMTNKEEAEEVFVNMPYTLKRVGASYKVHDNKQAVVSLPAARMFTICPIVTRLND